MNEYKNTQLAADMQSFATALVKAASDIATAAYDLREACRFYT